MRIIPLCVSAAVLAVPPAVASPIVGIHWGSCPYAQSEPTNRNPDGSTHQTITVTGRGLSGVVRGIGIAVQLKASERAVADAWRFDEIGCNRGHLAYNQVPASDPCPFFGGGNAQAINAAQYIAEVDISGYFDAAEVLYAYRAFDATTANPDVTYTLARFEVDLSPSCGCLDRQMCIALQNEVYLDAEGQENSMNVDREFLTWNDPTNSVGCPGGPDCFYPGCGPSSADTTCANAPTPVRTRSWGSIRASYR